MERSKASIAQEIIECLDNLSRTDYKAIKFAEGIITEEEYKLIREERQRWRKKINDLEALL